MLGHWNVIAGELRALSVRPPHPDEAHLSTKVYPAAGYAAEVRENGGHIAIFNIDGPPPDLDDEEDGIDFWFTGPCEVSLPKALGLEEKVSE